MFGACSRVSCAAAARSIISIRSCGTFIQRLKRPAKAREPKERLECLREMARTIPKHKGTEHLQSDIKTRIKQLTEQIAGVRAAVGG